jgi:hypothetical protein
MGKVKTIIYLGIFLFILGAIEDDKTESTTKKSFDSTEIPENYYSCSNNYWASLGKEGLEKLVQNGFVTPYQRNHFDCSEMAAYMEWYLKRYGFNETKICTSQHFKGSKAHAWLKVTAGDSITYIEPTASKPIVKIENQRDYENPENEYDNIYEIKNIRDFDWWKTIENPSQYFIVP